jgi:hypothetical protein
MMVIKMDYGYVNWISSSGGLHRSLSATIGGLFIINRAGNGCRHG